MSVQCQAISFQLVLVVKVHYSPSHSVSALMAEFDLAAPVTSGEVGPPWLDFYFLSWEVSFMSSFCSEVRGWLPPIWAELLSGAIRRLGTLKANTTVICDGAWSGWTRVGLPLPKVTCIYWVHTASLALSQLSPAFHAFPRSMSLRVSGALQWHWQLLTMCFVNFSGKSNSGNLVLGKAVSQMCHASYAPL